jgi:hypothetical protein
VSELAAVTREVQSFVAELRGLERPIHRSREAIGRAREVTARQQHDPRLRRAAMIRQDHLTRADRALREALQASARSATSAERWLAQHAASGVAGGSAAAQPAGGGGGGLGTAAPGGGGGSAAAEVAALLAAAGAAIGSAPAQLVQGYRGYADRHGQKVADGYAFGAIASVVAGGFNHTIEHNAQELLSAVAGAVLPPPAGVMAAIGIGLLAEHVIVRVSERATRATDAGSYSSFAHELHHRAQHPPQARWTTAEWVAASAKVAIPIAVSTVLSATGSGPLLAIVAGAAAGGGGWCVRASAHKGHGHLPRFEH